MVVAAFQSTTTQTLSRLLKRSSTLPAITTDGTAEAKPVTKRPTKTVAGEELSGMITQKMLNTADETM